MQKNSFNILNTIGGAYTPEARRILSELGDVEYRASDQDELGKIIGKYEVVVAGLGLIFNREVLRSAGKLKVIASLTTGLDHIDLTAAEKRGISVLSLRGEDAFLDTITGTAELAWGLVLDLVRRTPWAFDAVKRYEWQREDFRGHNLYGKTLGIVGLGRLGTWVARYAIAFGMNVRFYDPNVDQEQGLNLLHRAGFDHALTSPSCIKKMNTLEKLLLESDVVSIHVHLSKKTENLFAADTFTKMKPRAYLVNTSRGKIVDERALLQALESKKIAGYGTDVLAHEIEFALEGLTNHPLVAYAKTHDNCIIVPHIGGMTHESREATDVFIAKKLRNFLSGS